MTDRPFKEAVDADWKLARQAGITGVPSFIAGNYKVVGAQPSAAVDATTTAHLEAGRFYTLVIVASAAAPTKVEAFLIEDALAP